MSTDEFFEKVGTEPIRGPKNGWVMQESAAPVLAPTESRPHLIGRGTSWASSGDVFWRIGESHATIPPGVYRGINDPHLGPHFMGIKNETDSLVKFPDSEGSIIVDEIRRFQGMKEKFRVHGFLHKRGVLLWGPPGSGKTTTLQLLINLIVKEHNGIALLIDHPSTAAACLQVLRAVEPERQVVGILEDLDALVERHGESEYLALLDGESQVDNVVYVATTNYPERLDRRFVDRPSRFDTLRYIGMPSASARETYFQAKVPDLTQEECVEYVKASDGYSVAHLRELIILTRCFDVSLPEAKARLDKTRKVHPSSNKSPDSVGFGFTS